MGIALLALEGLFTPLQALLHHAIARRQVPAAHAARAITASTPAKDSTHGGHTHGAIAQRERAQLRAVQMQTSRRPAAPHRPLRVVRVIDPKARDAGRLVISGRMADVCAELDRLAELESRLH